MIKKLLNPKLFSEDIVPDKNGIEYQKTAQKIHLSVDSLTDKNADALILIPDLRYGYSSSPLYKSQFLRCGAKGS